MGLVQPGERMALEGPQSSSLYLWGRSSGRPSHILHSGAYERQQVLTETKHVETASKENLFSLMTVKYWKRLPREVVQCPFLEGFKTQMEKALSNFI